MSDDVKLNRDNATGINFDFDKNQTYEINRKAKIDLIKKMKK